jgi:IS4 transposase
MARPLYASDAFGVDLDAMVYALDATTIDLCLSLHPWAPFRKAKAAIKLHTLLDLRGNIPSFVHITDGLVHEVNVLDTLPIEAGAFYLMDRGYLDFTRLYAMHTAGAFFVTRTKSNTPFKRRYSNPVDKADTSTRVVFDQIGTLALKAALKAYPQTVRCVRIKDEQGKRITFLTNNMNLPAATIAALYKNRWQVELFFKWIKQHLRIKSFYGTSENAVKTQVWIALSTYVLIAIVKKRLHLSQSLYEILQILNLTMFEITSINQLFNNTTDFLVPSPEPQQLLLL